MDNIKDNKSNMVSRNAPVALVVGVAGFLGSHLTEELLRKNIQVIGVDDFSTGSKKNLTEVVKDKRFHFVNVSADKLDLRVDRLDYIFIVAEGGWSINSLLNLAKKHKCKIVLASSINLYDRKAEKGLEWYRQTESLLAKYSQDNKVNARVVRLAPIYGPRMHFRNEDSVGYLIRSAVRGEIEKENTTLEFSTRAMYVDDAVKLLIKSMFSGSTAWKIYDGGLLTPVKVAEIKQILLDPIWSENKGFVPSVLPPWPTPNLTKTVKELSWEPKSKVVSSLKETLSYFKENEIELDEKVEKPVILPTIEQPLKLGYKSWEPVSEENVEIKKENKKNKKKISWFSGRNFLVLLGWSVIIYGLLYPIFTLGFSLLTYRQNLGQAGEYLQVGEIDKSLESIEKAQKGVDQAQKLVNSLAVVKEVEFLKGNVETVEEFLSILSDVSESSEHAVLGSRAMLESLKLVSGEGEGDLKNYFEVAQVELAAADSGMSKAFVKFNLIVTEGNFPGFLNKRVDDLRVKMDFYSELVKKARAAAAVFPTVVAMDGKKSYLLVLQNNGELRPTGGFIGSIARVDFEGGKLKKLVLVKIKFSNRRCKYIKTSLS